MVLITGIKFLLFAELWKFQRRIQNSVDKIERFVKMVNGFENSFCYNSLLLVIFSLKAVSYFHKNLHFRSLKGFWLRLWILTSSWFTKKRKIGKKQKEKSGKNRYYWRFWYLVVKTICAWYSTVIFTKFIKNMIFRDVFRALSNI